MREQKGERINSHSILGKKNIVAKETTTAETLD
jgi:hypothetical protein